MSVAARSGPAPVTAAVVWLALLVASLAVGLDLVEHWRTSPWARYSAIFPVLAARVALRDAGGRWDWDPRAAAWVGLGVVIEVLAVGGGFERFGRLGLAVALLGMTGLHGVAGWSRRLCVLWFIPVPAFLAYHLDPTALWGWLGVFAGGLLGLDVHFADSLLRVGGASLELTVFDGGLAPVAALAGIGWHASADSGGSLRAAALRALRFGLLAVPIQATAVALAAASLAWLPPVAVRVGLSTGPWLAAAAVGLALWWRARSGLAARPIEAR